MLHTTSFTVSPLLTVTIGQAFVGAPWGMLSLKPETLAMMRYPPAGFWHPAGRFCVVDVLPVIGLLPPRPNLQTQILAIRPHRTPTTEIPKITNGPFLSTTSSITPQRFGGTARRSR